MADNPPLPKSGTYGIISMPGSTGNVVTKAKIRGMDVGVLEYGAHNLYEDLEVTSGKEEPPENDKD